MFHYVLVHDWLFFHFSHNATSLSPLMSIADKMMFLFQEQYSLRHWAQFEASIDNGARMKLTIFQRFNQCKLAFQLFCQCGCNFRFTERYRDLINLIGHI